MPELPEVETVCQGLSPLLVGQRICRARVYQPRLRYPVPDDFEQKICGQTVRRMMRRAKYMLIELDSVVLIIHLGMSGSLRWLNKLEPAAKHDHVDIWFEEGGCLRYRDPRRFGLVVLASPPVETHPLLSHLGPEPLSDVFDGDYLFSRLQGRRAVVKNLLMDNRLVVGVGNIYANEALFVSGLSPRLQGDQVTREQCDVLVCAIKQVLTAAIRAGGTTLQDFVNGHGKPGYFQQQLYVYGRTDEPCLKCGTFIESLRIGQRSSFYCPQCQPNKPV